MEASERNDQSKPRRRNGGGRGRGSSGPKTNGRRGRGSNNGGRTTGRGRGGGRNNDRGARVVDANPNDNDANDDDDASNTNNGIQKEVSRPRNHNGNAVKSNRRPRRPGRNNQDASRNNVSAPDATAGPDGNPAVANGRKNNGGRSGKGKDTTASSSGSATRNNSRTHNNNNNDNNNNNRNGQHGVRTNNHADDRGQHNNRRRNRNNKNGNINGHTNHKRNGRNEQDDKADNATQQQQQPHAKRSNKSRTKKVQYEPHVPLSTCLSRYAAHDATVVRGRIRVMPSRNGAAFVTCDRGSMGKDVLVKDEKDRNRALDGEYVFVELHPLMVGDEDGEEDGGGRGRGEERGGSGQKEVTIADFMDNLKLTGGATEGGGQKEKRMEQSTEEEMGDVEYEEEEYLINEEFDIVKDETLNEGEEEEEAEMWHDDEVQMSLWDPVINLRKKSKNVTTNQSSHEKSLGIQRSSKVIHILPPKSSSSGTTFGGGGKQPSEFAPQDESHRDEVPKRTIVGSLTRLPHGGRYLLVPNNKSLPRFMCPAGTKDDEGNNNNNNNNNNNEEEEERSNADADGEDNNNNDNSNASNAKILYRAEYAHGSWHATNKWPPCANVRRLCGTCNVEGETKALLVENGVDHGDFPPGVLRDVEESVESGRFLDGASGDMGWRPTEDMYVGRRDYRAQRVFTIDPTTARDLDDALHITPLEDGRVEIGVHIADVSHFIPPSSAVDKEALKRATTVYLVNGIVPMLPRPLCEIACSLNENVERLAFSCVWRMNMDGTLSKKKGCGGKKDDIWYGRTVIKSCARLDYATAQNIIDKKVANGEKRVDEAFWPKSRQPTGGHTIDEVAGDVRLMHKVAMARRKLRFDNGALALNGVKLAFQLEEDGETPKLCAPYPIRDSNRLIEEFMLLANYLVAQRLITHASGRALLRNHNPPIEQGMQQVVDVSRESFDFHIDTTDSKTLQESLSRLSRECDDALVVQCVTESLMTPMRPAEYLAAGELDEADWSHFALNIPYYTHFTSPIRRYPDVIVHRLLQATLDEEVDDFPQTQKEIHSAALHCNDMRMSAKKAQERSDRVFLSLYLKTNPISSTLGVCLGVGEKTFTVFVPSLGLSTRVFLQEHEDEFDVNAFEDDDGGRRIVIRPKTNDVPGMQRPGDGEGNAGDSWKSLDVRVFTKLEVACTCKMQPPIDVRVKVVGPWKGEE